MNENLPTGQNTYRKRERGKDPVLTHAQERFTISEVATDWHELMIPQRIMRPSIARASEHWTRRAACRHTTVLISYTRPSPRSP